MPEYGRGIQEMVDYAVTLTDRDERQRCANTIVTIMGNMFPHLRDVPDFKHKLWDHLAIMADYKLDIDYPSDEHDGHKEHEDIEHIENHPYAVPFFRLVCLACFHCLRSN